MAREFRSTIRSIFFQVRNSDRLNDMTKANEALCEEWAAFAVKKQDIAER